jgi:TRAP-type C4-dicarboxylate transport system permease small subunit
VKALLRVLRLVEDGFLALLLVTMLGFALAQIVLRNLFDSGIAWGDDLVRTLILWVALVGSMIAARQGRHIRIDALLRLAPDSARPWIERGMDLVTAILCGFMARLGQEFWALEYADGFVAFGAVPSWVPVAMIPVAFTIMGLRYLLHAATARPSLTRTDAAR